MSQTSHYSTIDTRSELSSMQKASTALDRSTSMEANSTFDETCSNNDRRRRSEVSSTQRASTVIDGPTELKESGVSKIHTVSFDDGFYPDKFKDPQSTPTHRYHLYNIIIALNCFLVSLFASAYLYVAPAIASEFETSTYICKYIRPEI